IGCGRLTKAAPSVALARSARLRREYSSGSPRRRGGAAMNHRGISRRQFAAGSVASTALALPTSRPRAENAGGTLVVGHVSLRHLNPAIQSGNATGVPGMQIFAGLVQLDDKFQPQPYLARSWEASQDKLSYTFHLVEGATFHDGRPITSEDV